MNAYNIFNMGEKLYFLPNKDIICKEYWNEVQLNT